MTQVVILSAGDCTRLPDAPHGNKSLIEIAGQRVIDWQLGSLPRDAEVTVVCKTRAAHQFPQAVEIVICDESAGPLHALSKTFHVGPCTVIFSDTLFAELPEDPTSWIGIGLAKGGRNWEFHNGLRSCRRAYVPVGLCQAVHCGIYRFSDLDKVRWNFNKGSKWVHMLTDYRFKQDKEIRGWLDVGDEEAVERAAEELMLA